MFRKSQLGLIAFTKSMVFQVVKNTEEIGCWGEKICFNTVFRAVINLNLLIQLICRHYKPAISILQSWNFIESTNNHGFLKFESI